MRSAQQPKPGQALEVCSSDARGFRPGLEEGEGDRGVEEAGAGLLPFCWDK